MKRILTLAIVLVFGIFTPNCSNEDTDENTSSLSVEKNIEHTNWTLTNLSGGFIGLNQDYKPGTIEWRFDSKNSILYVKNNDPKGTKFDVLKPGEYHYTVLKQKGSNYLYIEGNEFGNLNNKGYGLVINQNKTTNGSLSDGYILRFIK